MGTTAAVHPADPILQAFGLGKLDDNASASVSKHLEACDSCRRRVSKLSSDEFLGRLRQAAATPDKAASGWSPSATMSSDGARRPVGPPPPVDTLPPGLAEHEDYEVIGELGRGGMGVVYLVENKLMGRKEVLKVVGAHLINRPGVADRFLREIRSAARLHHTNIVTAYTALRFGESLALAMEYVNGYDLSQLVKAKGPLSVPQACNFVYQAAQGLQHALEHGMVHRDIKPSNLMLTRQGKRPIVKVLDFGLAKVTSEGQSKSDLTREGQMLGTPDFIAPEQIRDAQSADIRADVYSLGCTLYYLLAGRPPFAGDHVWDVYQAQISMIANPLNLVRTEVPVEVAAIVAKMMAKEPGRRFQVPKQVAQALMPFFKLERPGSVGSKPELSQAGQTNASRLVSTATQPATDAGTSAARDTKGAKTAASETKWESLIDVREEERAKHSTPAIDPDRRPPWKKWRIAIAGPLFGLVAFGGIIITILGRGGREILKVEVPESATYVIGGSRGKGEANPPEKGRGDAGPENVMGPANSRGPIGGGARRSPLQVVLRSQVERRGLVISGSWMTQGDELVQTSPAYQISELVFGDPNWSRYDLSFEVKKDTEGWGGMGGRRFTTLFHWSNTNNKCWYSGYNDAHEIASVVNGNWSRDWELRAGNWVGAKGELEDGRWYPVRIEVRGKAVKCFFNDSLMFDDVHPSLSQGRIGFGSADAQIRFRRIKVIDPDGKVLFEGLPNIGE